MTEGEAVSEPGGALLEWQSALDGLVKSLGPRRLLEAESSSDLLVGRPVVRSDVADEATDITNKVGGAVTAPRLL